jgi:hypothetical protein
MVYDWAVVVYYTVDVVMSYGVGMPYTRCVPYVDDLNVSSSYNDLLQASELDGSSCYITSVSVGSVQEIEDAQVLLTTV